MIPALPKCFQEFFNLGFDGFSDRKTTTSKGSDVYGPLIHPEEQVVLTHCPKQIVDLQD